MPLRTRELVEREKRNLVPVPSAIPLALQLGQQGQQFVQEANARAPGIGANMALPRTTGTPPSTTTAPAEALAAFAEIENGGSTEGLEALVPAIEKWRKGKTSIFHDIFKPKEAENRRFWQSPQGNLLYRNIQDTIRSRKAGQAAREAVAEAERRAEAERQRDTSTFVQSLHPNVATGNPEVAAGATGLSMSPFDAVAWTDNPDQQKTFLNILKEKNAQINNAAANARALDEAAAKRAKTWGDFWNNLYTTSVRYFSTDDQFKRYANYLWMERSGKKLNKTQQAEYGRLQRIHSAGVRAATALANMKEIDAVLGNKNAPPKGDVKEALQNQRAYWSGEYNDAVKVRAGGGLEKVGKGKKKKVAPGESKITPMFAPVGEVVGGAAKGLIHGAEEVVGSLKRGLGESVRGVMGTYPTNKEGILAWNPDVLRYLPPGYSQMSEGEKQDAVGQAVYLVNEAERNGGVLPKGLTPSWLRGKPIVAPMGEGITVTPGEGNQGGGGESTFF